MFIEMMKFFGGTIFIVTASLAVNVGFPRLVYKYTKSNKWQWAAMTLAGVISLGVLSYAVASGGERVKEAFSNRFNVEDFIYENQCRIVDRVTPDRRIPGGPVYHYICPGMDFWR